MVVEILMQSFWQIYDILSYLIGLTFEPGALWNVIPLVIATILIVVYFGVFHGEKPGWGSYVSNSLVLLFVSMNLLKYIYTLGGGELGNIIDYPLKTGAVIFLLLISLVLLRVNFARALPKKIAAYLGSTITVNLIAYAMILFVYATIPITWQFIAALVILVVLLSVLLKIIRKPLKKLHSYFIKLKLKERLQDVKEAKFQTLELKEEVKEREKELKGIKKKEVDQKEKEVKSFKKIFKGLFRKKPQKRKQRKKKK